MLIKLPHDETDPDKRYSMPDPDALADAYQRVRSHWSRGAQPSEGNMESDLAAVLALARGYLDLTTYELGQECCVGKLRDIWRARRARETGRG